MHAFARFKVLNRPVSKYWWCWADSLTLRLRHKFFCQDISRDPYWKVGLCASVPLSPPMASHVFKLRVWNRESPLYSILNIIEETRNKMKNQFGGCFPEKMFLGKTPTASAHHVIILGRENLWLKSVYLSFGTSLID